jgi:long-chain acyl-CoA synthetase
MPLGEIRAATARVTSKGQPYELVDETIDGARFKVFKNAPANLRELYRSGLAFAERDLYVFEGERYTFDATWKIVARVARGLERLGVKHGDRVAIAMRNYPEWIFAFMGATSMGAVAVAMNGWWSGEELEYGLDDSGATVLIADMERLDRLAGRLESRGVKPIAVRTSYAKI